MRKTLLVSMMLGLAGLVACMQSPDKHSTSSPEEVLSGTPETYYFRAGTFSEDDASDGATRGWYSRNLRRMEESPLKCATSEAGEVYRFLWLRSFDHPVAVRIFRQDNAYGLVAVVLDGQGGYDPGHISRRVSKEPSAAEWQKIMAALEEVQFWQMPTHADTMATDGAQWIVEGCRGGLHHVVDRRNGTDGMQSVGKTFLGLAGLGDIEPVY